MTEQIRVATWPGHGVILAAGNRLVYRRDSDGKVEDWPEPGTTLREKVRRLLSMPGELVPCAGLGTEVAEELRAEREASEARREGDRARWVEEARREGERLNKLAELIAPGTRGWRKGTVTLSLREGPKEVPGLLSPCGHLAVHRREGCEGYALTHVPSGKAVGTGDQKRLKMLGARLLLVGRIESRDPTRREMELWAPVGLAFKRTGNPLAEEARL